MNGWIDDSDLPNLQSITLDKWALDGDGHDDRWTISDDPYNYKNTLTMRSEINLLRLPVLFCLLFISINSFFQHKLLIIGPYHRAY